MNTNFEIERDFNMYRIILNMRVCKIISRHFIGGRKSNDFNVQHIRAV